MKLYHGTSSKSIPQIKRKGLVAPKYEAGHEGIFLTDDEFIARNFADIKVDYVGGKRAICEVEVDLSNLSADWNFYSLPDWDMMAEYGCGDFEQIEDATDCWGAKIESGEIPSPKNDMDWETSLRVVHSVTALKPIPPHRIRCRVIDK